MGQIVAHFETSDPAEREVTGTGTIYFMTSQRKFLIVTAAHNLVKFNKSEPIFATQNSRFIFQRDGKHSTKYEMSINDILPHPDFLEFGW